MYNIANIVHVLIIHSFFSATLHLGNFHRNLLVAFQPIVNDYLEKLSSTMGSDLQHCFTLETWLPCKCVFFPFPSVPVSLPTYLLPSLPPSLPPFFPSSLTHTHTHTHTHTQQQHTLSLSLSLTPTSDTMTYTCTHMPSLL